MTAHEPLLVEWLQDGPEMGPVEGLERALAAVHRTRQRPGWTFPERWLPMDTTMRRSAVPRLPSTALLLILLALLLALAVAIAAIGSRPLSPFGPAVPGVIAFETTGDISVGDPVTGEVRTIVGGDTHDVYPVFSRDGTRIAFIRDVPGGKKVMSVPVRGGQPTELTPTAVPFAGLLKWSPDGGRVAFLVQTTGSTPGTAGGTLWVAESDGSGAHAVDLGFRVDAEMEWRPPDGRELIVRGVKDGVARLYLVRLDGSAPIALTPEDPGEYNLLWLAWAPDGRRVAYSNDAPRSIHILRIEDRQDVTIAPKDGLPLMFPRWSPDGTRIAAMAWLSEGKQQIAVMPADDPTPTSTLTGPKFASGIQHDWSPDGNRILAVEWGTTEPWLLDPAGGPATRAPWEAAIPDWVEWQRLPA
jgi:Tol biopolymer transport system component